MDGQETRPDRVVLNDFAFYGRTLAEYQRIFDLDLTALRGLRLLDCPAGPSSFVAEMTAQGFDITGCDPLFDPDVEALVARCQADIARMMVAVEPVKDRFVWAYYESLDDLRAHRETALARFAADYPAGRAAGRYVQAALPDLPFEDDRFDLVLSSHLLFLYDDRLDEAFHRAALDELLRVGRAVCIYPLQTLAVQPYPHLDALLDALRARGVSAEYVPVPFEFQRGSTHMLRLRRE